MRINGCPLSNKKEGSHVETCFSLARRLGRPGRARSRAGHQPAGQVGPGHREEDLQAIAVELFAPLQQGLHDRGAVEEGRTGALTPGAPPPGKPRPAAAPTSSTQPKAGATI